MLTTLPHQLLRQPQSPVRAHNAQRRDMSVLYAVCGIFFHFREDVADDLGGIVGGFFGPGLLRESSFLLTPVSFLSPFFFFF